MKKRILSVVTTVVLCLCLLPMSVLAEEGETELPEEGNTEAAYFHGNASTDAVPEGIGSDYPVSALKEKSRSQEWTDSLLRAV